MSGRRVLPRDYTADELDRGVGMVFHPSNGKQLSLYSYSIHDPVYYWRGGWAGFNVSLDRISDGKDKKAGDLLPLHWKFDPWEGVALPREHEEVVQLLGVAHNPLVRAAAASGLESAKVEILRIQKDLERLIESLK